MFVSILPAAKSLTMIQTMNSIDATTDRVHEESISTPITSVLDQLKSSLGEKLMEFVLGEDLGQNEERARGVFEVLLLLTAHDDDAVARAWLIGMNPMLDEMAPAELLARGEVETVRIAARSFLVTG